jgi:putative membrane protein
MSARAFASDAARARVEQAVKEIEAVTSAEVVVAVVPRSGHYRHTDYLVGFVFAFASLLVFLFHPHPFDARWYPLELLAAFVFGTLASAGLPLLRRALTSKSLMAENVARAARSDMVRLGVTKTRHRTGVLVYVSLLERDVELVLDVGLEPGMLGNRWQSADAALDAAIRSADLEAFLKAMKALGPLLQETCPLREDDENELSDAPRLS